VINLAREINTVPVGIINWAGNGDKAWITYGSNLSAINTGLMTRVHGYYSMITVGAVNLQEDIENALFFSWHYGYSVKAGGNWRIGGDLGFVHIIPEISDNPDENDRLHFAVQARLLADVRLADQVSVFFGGGVSLRYSEYSAKAHGELEPLAVLGFTAF
jgi:hypothetical protein